MSKKVRLNFGERMREWRRVRKEYVDKIKNKVRKEMDINQNHPAQPGESEKKSLITSPTETTEMKTGEIGPIPQPSNSIELAINKLREQAAKL